MAKLSGSTEYVKKSNRGVAVASTFEALLRRAVDRTAYVYYVRRLAPELNPGEEQYHRRVYLHRVGSDPDDDVLIFGAGRDRTQFYTVDVTADGRCTASQPERFHSFRRDRTTQRMAAFIWRSAA